MTHPLVRIAQVAFLRGFGALALLMLTYVVTHTLDVTSSGRFLYLLSIVVVGAPVLVFGTNLVSLRLIAVAHDRQRHAELNGVVALGFITLLVSWSVTACIGALALAVLPAEAIPEHLQWLARSTPPLLLTIGVTSLSILVAHQLQGLSLPTHSVVTLSILGPCSFSLILLLQRHRIDSAGDALLILMLSSALAMAYGVVQLWRHVRKSSPKLPDRRAFLTACLPVWIVAMATVATNWSAQLISILFLDANTIALLSVSQRIAMSISLVLIAINLVISPRIAALYAAGNTAGLQTLVSRAVLGILSFSLPVVGLICLAPGSILSLFGEEYRAASAFLIAFALGQLINMVTGPSVQLLTMTGHERVVMRIALIASVMTIACAALLLGTIGAMGVPIATSFGIALQNVLAALAARSLTSVNVFRADLALPLRRR